MSIGVTVTKKNKNKKDCVDTHDVEPIKGTSISKKEASYLAERDCPFNR